MTDEFEGFPKIPRLNREMVVTEKVDGANHSILINAEGVVRTFSRNREATLTDDSFGFAAWVEERKSELVGLLGEGRHFGEWYGRGIQRGYGLAERRFMLFNWYRHGDTDLSGVPQLEVVTKLGSSSRMDTELVDATIGLLRRAGSLHVPGFMRPEGVVVYHVAARQSFKATLERDEEWKGKHDQTCG